MDIYDEKAAYMLGFYPPAIWNAVVLLIGEFSTHISHTEILKAISPLKAAIRRLFPRKEAEKQIGKLSQIYTLFSKLKLGPIIDDREGLGISCTIEDLCNEIEESVNEFAEGTFKGRAKALFKSGSLLGLWEISKKSPLKLSENTMKLLIANMKAANLNQAAEQSLKLHKMKNKDFEEVHYPAVWNVHIGILDKLDMEIAESEITKDESLSALTKLPDLRQFDKDTCFLLTDPERPVTLAFIDMDDLKVLNKKVGHDIADSVIQQVAATIKTGLSHRAKLYHRSGDEFLAVFRNTSADEVIIISERVIEKVKSTDFHTPAGIQKCTISIGVASYPEHSTELDTLKENANKAMEIAKERGKSNVIVWKGGSKS